MKSLKTTFFILASFIFSSIHSQEIVDHTPWDHLLVLNVDDNGMVNYEGLTSDVIVFYTYFRYLQNISHKKIGVEKRN